MKRLHLAFIPVLLFIAATTGAQAQLSQTAVGPKVGLYLDNSLFMLGAVAEFPITPDLDIEPGAELVFGISNTTRLVLDGNGRWSFTLQGSDIRPFVLGGIGLVTDFVSVGGESDSRTDIRLNLGAGTVFNSRSLTQFWGGLKIFFLSDEGSDILLQTGVNFYL